MDDPLDEIEDILDQIDQSISSHTGKEESFFPNRPRPSFYSPGDPYKLKFISFVSYFYTIFFESAKTLYAELLKQKKYQKLLINMKE